MITVDIRSDGALKGVTVERSSTHKLLDDAAVRFVRLSAPYSPFPPHIRAEVDELSITRTFSFNEIFWTD
jgi:protein TonB